VFHQNLNFEHNQQKFKTNEEDFDTALLKILTFLFALFYLIFLLKFSHQPLIMADDLNTNKSTYMPTILNHLSCFIT